MRAKNAGLCDIKALETLFLNAQALNARKMRKNLNISMNACSHGF